MNKPQRVWPREPGWDGVLEKGETILWKGYPETVPGFRPIHIGLAAMGLVFAALGFTALQSIGLIWIEVPEDVTAKQSILASLFTAIVGVFGLGMFLGGVLMILGPAFYQRFAPSRVAFVLTDRHAYIETRWFWRHVRRVRIVPDEIEVSPNSDGPEPTGRVTFWRRVMRKNGRRNDKTFSFRHQPEPESIANIARQATRG